MIKVTKAVNEDNIVQLININIAALNSSLELQELLSKQILSFLKNFMSNTDISSIFSDEINDFISSASVNLKKINCNISVLNNLIETLNKIKSTLETENFEEVVSKIKQYNKKSGIATDNILKSTSKIQEFIQSMFSLDISQYLSVQGTNNFSKIEEPGNTPEPMQNPVSDFDKTDSSLTENTLIISETNGTVTLPYKMSDIADIMYKFPDKYSSLKEVVLNLYTKPIKDYKYAAIARFREAYKLIIERDHGTKRAAFKLATELFTNYNLHPAIITACKNSNELDVYLSCLEFNELEDFHFFKIVYDVLPVAIAGA